MQIRAGTEDDAAAAIGLWTEAYTRRGPEGRKTPYVESEYFDSYRDGRVFVAEEAGAVLGVVVFLPSGVATWTGEDEAALTRLAVTTTVRGRGVGRALAERCGEEAEAAGASAIVLWSRPYQTPAHRLYESLGYRYVPARDSSDADGGRRVFVRDLTKPSQPSSDAR
ncbi:MAG TPA: GNAT family N-acetyltransferase [Solirubrobacterales bacterium]|nr:GNAT family N-acetyltransferase [Solirubrobacterales bacterium]